MGCFFQKNRLKNRGKNSKFKFLKNIDRIIHCRDKF